MTIRLPDGHAVERACADDHAWFEAHPHETTRVRDLVPGELEPAVPAGEEGDADAILVTVIAPGLRTRQPVRRIFITAGSEAIQ